MAARIGDGAALSQAAAAADRDAAVDHDVGPGHELGIVAGQVEGGPGDVLGQARLGDRLDLGPDLGDAGGHLVGDLARQAHRGAEDRGGDQARADGVDPDLQRRQLGRRAAAHVDHRRLGRRIGQGPEAGLQAGDRGGVDDRAAAALQHQRQGVLHAQHRPAHQQGEGPVPALGVMSGTPAGVPPWPALLNRMSRPPNALLGQGDGGGDLGFRR
jgi:hypothetical protein